MDRFSTLTESYFFYEGTEELRYDKEAHVYFRVNPELGNLEELHGVTTVLKIIDRSAALVPWGAKMVIEKLLRLIPTETRTARFGGPVELCIPKMSLADFTKIALEAKTAPRDKLVDAGDIGHAAHECLEKSIQHAIDHTNGVVLELRELPEDEKAKACAQAGFAWMQAHKVRWIKTEQKIYSREYGYAGTMDGKAIVDSCDDPACCSERFKDSLSIVDWKSSNDLHIEYILQVAGAYHHAEVEEYGEDIQNCFILRLGKNEEEAGKFAPWRIPARDFPRAFQGFLLCLQLVDLVEELKVWVSTQKKEVREIKKRQHAEQKEIDKMKAKVEKEAEKAQKKLDRAVERDRIKAEAKTNREAIKNAKKTNISGVVSENTTTSDMGRPEPINEVPRQAVYTQATPMAPAAVAEVAEETAEVSEPLHNNTEGSSEGSTTTHSFEEAIENALADNRLAGLPTPTWAEETPVERKPFVIPEG